MSISDLAIKRPIFITCIFLLMIIMGVMSLFKLGVDLFPNVNFPIVVVTTPYSGAGPSEIETLVSKPLEDALTTVNGVKNVRSTNEEGVSIVLIEFELSVDSKYAEQQVKDRVTAARPHLPKDVQEPVVRAFDPSDQPILTVSLMADMKPADLYDVAENDIKPLIEQVNDVGMVDIIGGRKREIHVLLDRDKLRRANLSAALISNQIGGSGQSVPAGKVKSKDKEAIVRTLGEYNSLATIRETLVSFFGNEAAVQVNDLGEVKEAYADELSRTTIDGKPAMTFLVFRRSGANTIAVANAVKKKITKINDDYSKSHKGFKINVVHDGSRPIRANVDDVEDSIKLGILLTIFVVFIFLGSIRSTLITGIALPNSLLGAFVLMSLFGFTINVMTLLALSLAVGLLIDDAIVVRENIFRHIENGMSPREAASHGTKEVTLAVIATTLTVIAVFGPVAFLDGIVGQFFKEFGLTICFIMAISLFDALTMAPMLSAYFAGSSHKTKGIGTKIIDAILKPFDMLWNLAENFYIWVLKKLMNLPSLTLLAAVAIFVGSLFALKHVAKTFLPQQDIGEFTVNSKFAPGTNLDRTAEVTKLLDEAIRKFPEVALTVVTDGGRNGEANQSEVYVQLVGSKDRKVTTGQFKAMLTPELQKFPEARAKIFDISGFGNREQPFNVNIIGSNMDDLLKVSQILVEKLKSGGDLLDVDMSYEGGKPEYRVVIDRAKADQFGISSTMIGMELRTQIEGMTPSVYRVNDLQYDIRVRMQEDQRDIKNNFDKVFVANMNQRLIKLSDVAKLEEKLGPATIDRLNRSRYIQVSGAIDPSGKGLGHAIEEVKRIFDTGEIKMPAGVSFKFSGQAESFQDLIRNILIAALLAVLFIYLVLSSLYESFVTPFAIMLVLPLAACGAFYALAITGKSLDLFSMIGCIMLLGVATKNSILLVDYISQQMREGKTRAEAILEAGRVRLRPIIMTSLALIAGMLPVAIGLSEASKQRTSMGVAVIGGILSSTLLTLVVVPAAYAYIDGFKLLMRRYVFRSEG